MADIMDYFNTGEWAEDQLAENEAFVGDVLDEKKIRRLNSLKSDCRAISRAEPRIRFNDSLLHNGERNGHARLDFPSALFIDDERICKRIGALFAFSDFAVIAETEDGSIRLTFGVKDMWAEYHNDLLEEKF